MVTIKFNPKKLELSMDGHAEYAEHGKDIVCSAVSILFYTLVYTIEESERAIKVSKTVKDGKVKIKVKPKEKGERDIQFMFWQTLNGFKLLSEDYPANVRLEIV